ncbi:SCO4225 family membrane protein [Streptomyces sp. NPDC053474]|uniref:SCO4225 family membrane protein n=1 Tax=Streptomyces sp. NPDC053474 TaxID=3365704 RepID=UPI0037D49DDE
MPPAYRPRRRLRRLLALATDTWLARVYLAVVAAALAFFLGAWYAGPDPGLAGFYPFLATAPLGALAFLASLPAEQSSLTWLAPTVFAVGTAAAGLCNAALLGSLTRVPAAKRAFPKEGQ